MTATQDLPSSGIISIIIVITLLYGMASGALLYHLYLKWRRGEHCCHPEEVMSSDPDPEHEKDKDGLPKTKELRQVNPPTSYRDRKPKHLSIITAEMHTELESSNESKSE